MDGARAAAVESKRGEFGSGGGSSQFEQLATVHERVCRASQIGCIAWKKSG